MTKARRAAGFFNAYCKWGENLRFKRVLLFGVFLYSKTIKTSHGRNLAHCGRYYPARRSELDAIRAQYHRTPGRIAARGTATSGDGGYGKSDPAPVRASESPKSSESESRESRKSPESRSKVEKVGSFIKSLESRKLLESRKSRVV